MPVAVHFEQKNAWVGVFDILGFKEKIRHTDQIVNLVPLINQLNNLFEALHDDYVQHGKLKRIMFSDTIVIFAPNSELSSYGWFLGQCTELVEKSITVELPVRGAISVGTAFISSDPPMIIGPAFLEAYENCEGLDWIGLLLAPSAALAICQAGHDPLHHSFVWDDIPLKNVKMWAYRFQSTASKDESPLLVHLEDMQNIALRKKDKKKYSKTISFIKKHWY